MNKIGQRNDKNISDNINELRATLTYENEKASKIDGLDAGSDVVSSNKIKDEIENEMPILLNNDVGALDFSDSGDDEWYRDIEHRVEEILCEDQDTEASLRLSSLDQSDSIDSLNKYYQAPIDHLCIACTNARSVVHKIGSLITLFDECGLHFAILTETWLNKKHTPPRVLNDLMHGADLKLIRKDRGRGGGGVAVCYNPTKLRLSNFPVCGGSGDYEVVCTVGNVALTKRKIAVLAVYLPPNLKSCEVRGCLDNIVATIDKLTIKFGDPILFVGGDFNDKSMSNLTDAFPSLIPIKAGATRNGRHLDEVYCNVSRSISHKEILKPLSKEDGTPSDHLIINASIKLPKRSANKSTTFTFRPLTTKGTDKFKQLLLSTDWDTIRAD